MGIYRVTYTSIHTEQFMGQNQKIAPNEVATKSRLEQVASNKEIAVYDKEFHEELIQEQMLIQRFSKMISINE